MPVHGAQAPLPTSLAINGQSIQLEGSHGSFGEDPSGSGVHAWEVSRRRPACGAALQTRAAARGLAKLLFLLLPAPDHLPRALSSSHLLAPPKVRLVLEFCDRGTMRDLLNQGCFQRPDGGRDLAGVIATALDVARAMEFLHEHQIVHADLKVGAGRGRGGGGGEGLPWRGTTGAGDGRLACWRSLGEPTCPSHPQARNVLLKSSGTDPRGFTAKVGACRCCSTPACARCGACGGA
jgi:serine/threonine protein kinase